ncbi:transcriptional regulator, IclR family [Roseomonas rosea]|uniref:Transcriptional regulator, IclR family n=1 Tax=Muricoccus roseus TaxID=198092 RepID=A0A1M6CFG1_9PROT|nr:IclR family transcriptional regulator C-terminal domain-containing protein [Roseomonas rosea]SHI59759.1 transcriptional regulator, IclR family [Roseomonas rosea]
MSHIVDQAGEKPDARTEGAALLDKACDVLEAIAASRGGIGQAELALQLGMSRTTLYRILGALVARGLVRQDPARRVYALGFRLLEMAQSPGLASGPVGPDLAAIAAPELRALRDATGETAYVAVMEGREVLSLGKFEGAHEVRSATRLGQRKPLHCTSQGKAILAFLPEEEREGVLKRLPLPALTPHTITDRRRFATSLRIIRSRGFSIDDEEIALGIRCVGAPILNAEGKVLGAVSVAGPSFRMTRERVDLLGPELAAAGRRIGAGVRSPSPTPHVSSITVLPGPAAFFGLGPRSSGPALWWADALAPELRLLSGAEDRRVTRWEAPIRGLAAAPEGDALVLDATGHLARIAPGGKVRREFSSPTLAEIRGFRVHPEGTVWGIQWLAEEGASLIGPMQLDGMLGRSWRLPGQAVALAWAVDGGALFAAVPSSGTVYKLELGRPVPLTLARLPAGGGRPAGLATDVEGGVWVALQDGWSVARLSPEGEVERVLPLPVPRPTDLAFGGQGLTTLYIATARDGVALETLASAPLSGRLLAASPGVTGVAESEARLL